MVVGGTNGSGTSSIDMTMNNPFASLHTGQTSVFQTLVVAPGTFATGTTSSQMTVTTSYTGFTLIPSAGTITGSVSVYGFNK